MDKGPQNKMARAGARECLHAAGLAVIDVLCAIVAFSAALSVACQGYNFSTWLVEHQNFVFIAVFLTVLNFYFFDLYYVAKDFRRYNQFTNLILALGLVFLALVITAFLDRSLLPGRKFVFFYLLFLFVFTAVNRSVYSLLVKTCYSKVALVVGCNPISMALARLVKEREKNGEDVGFKLAGYLSEPGCCADGCDCGLPCLGSIDNIEEAIGNLQPELVIYGPSGSGSYRATEILIREKLKGVDLVSAAGLYEGIAHRISSDYTNSEWLIEDCLRARKFTEVRVKRLFDIIFGSLLLLSSLPVIAVCAVMIKLESRGPAVFAQERIGMFGRPFILYKLRTMVAPKPGESAEEPEGPNLYAASKGRLTGFGRLLRSTHLDELPQFFNVVKGEMSIVGPRPEMEVFTRMCEDRIPFYRLRLAVKPGITGWAQVRFWHTSTLSGYKRKFEYDLYYLANLSLRLDLEIMLRTVTRMLGLAKEESV